MGEGFLIVQVGQELRLPIGHMGNEGEEKEGLISPVELKSVSLPCVL